MLKELFGLSGYMVLPQGPSLLSDLRINFSRQDGFEICPIFEQVIQFEDSPLLCSIPMVGVGHYCATRCILS